MDTQFGSSYPLPYSQSSQTPSQVAPMGGYSAGQHTPNSTTPAAQDSAHPTLPPLQPQNGYSHFGALAYGHAGSGAPTPTSHTPTSASISNGNSFSHVSPATMGPPGGYGSHYPMSQSMMYSSPTSTSLPQPGTANGLAALRPALPTTLGQLPSLTAAHLGGQPSFMQNEEAPTHVVGSQGRRGILPSAPGRPTASGGTGTSIKNMMPQKDADGKFPCPHCNKTYLHAKHLKRHMLRHTGDRPYSCHLCKDTFSRSDILKRHFQKCSIRRGNPTGANHLAHQRRGNNSNRLSISQQDGPVGLAGLAEVNGGNPYGTDSPTVAGDVSNRTSRANSLISPASMSHRNSIAGLGILSNGSGATDPLAPNSFAPNMHQYGLPAASGAPQLTSAYAYTQPSINGAYFTPPNAQPAMPYMGHQSSRFDHSHSNSPSQQSPNGDVSHNGHHFAQNGQDGYMNGDIKSEHESKHFPDPVNGEVVNSTGPDYHF